VFTTWSAWGLIAKTQDAEGEDGWGDSRRRQQLVDMIGRHAPTARVTGMSAGLHIVVEQPGRTGAELVRRAAHQQPTVEPATSSSTQGLHRSRHRRGRSTQPRQQGPGDVLHRCAGVVSVAANPATPDADEPGIRAIIEQVGTDRRARTT
jgi:hypothetical protein